MRKVMPARIKPTVPIAQHLKSVPSIDKYWPQIDNRYKIGQEARQLPEQAWFLCVAFYCGLQYSYYNASSHTLHHLRPLPGRVRLVDNQILPRVRRQISDAVRNRPKMSVVPNSNDEEDIKAARIAEKVTEHFWRQNQISKKLRLMNTWRFVCGNAFLDDRWNKKLGPMVKNEKGDLVYEGDADVGVWSPFEIFVPSTAMGNTNIHAFPWMLKAKWRDLSWIDNGYEEGHRVMEEAMPSTLVRTASIYGTQLGGAGGVKVPGAIVKELYIQPCREFPKGCMLVGANGIVLQDKQDYPFNEYDIEHFKDIEIPGSFWGQPTMQSALNLQKAWNRTISSVDEFNRKMGKGKWLIPRGAEVEIAMDDTHGEQVTYTPYLGYKPEQLDLKGLPTTYPLILDIIQNSFQDLFSQHEVSRGTNKSDIRSGEMVGLLLEQDSTGAVPSHRIFEESLEAVFSRVLKRIQKGYSNERTIKIVGKEGQFEVFAFKGADLHNNTDVSVEEESTLPDSRIMREERILNKYKEGLYGHPEDPKVRRMVTGMLRDATADDLHSEDRLDETNARMENQLITSGKVDKLIVNQYDNHVIHSEEHGKFQKSAEWQQIKFQDPQTFMRAEIVFMRHNQEHQKFVDQAQAKQIAMMEKAKGSGGS